MAREKKATGEAPKKRTSRSKTPVAVAQETAQHTPETQNPTTLQTAGHSGNGASTTERKTTQFKSDDEIRRRAYELWEQRGRQHGKDADDWYRAESEFRGKSA